MLAGGELRQGALAGIVTDGVAAAAGVAPAAVRRAAMLAGDLPAVAEAALALGADGLAGFGLQVGRPVQPMLAKTAPSLEAALAQVSAGGRRVEARRRAHPGAPRRRRRVAIFTRTLDPIADRMPEIAEAVRSAAAAHGHPRRRGDRAAPGRAPAAVPGDREPRREPRRRRRAAPGGAAHGVLLRRAAPRRPRPARSPRTRAARGDRAASCRPAPGCRASSPRARPRPRPSLRTRSREATRASSSSPSPPPTRPGGEARAGSRSSRCTRSTSSCSLPSGATAGARDGSPTSTWARADGEADGFVMLGKTFKGLTDELLEWQTARLLELESPARRLDGLRASATGRRDRLRRHPDEPALPRAAWRCASRASLRYREDKRADEADTIETVRLLHAARTG